MTFYRILVTGGAGFVGSAMALGLKARYSDSQVTVLDNLKRRGSELNLPRFKQAGIEFVHGDIRSPEDLDANLLKPDLIVECSAEPSVLAGYSSPGYVVQTNLVGTINCLELARQARADFLFFSTSRVYPVAAITQLSYQETATRLTLLEDQHLPGVSAAGIAEDFPLEGARSLYGATKLASELLITEYAEAYGLRAVINRCGVLTGPWQMGKVDQGVFALWMLAHYFNRSLKYIGFGGTGKQVRDFLHIDDLLDLVYLQLDNWEQVHGQVFNVGGGVANSLSLLETTQLCEQITGQQISIQSSTEDRPGDIPIFITDSGKVQARLGWQPQRDARQTLTDIYNWIDHNAEALKALL
ncbi:MAG: NAD-dependent epimerase/dehydratase family protein [Nodosilinea sp. LVE1205-7]|jgi:CDP-paratose 2-epimerase